MDNLINLLPKFYTDNESMKKIQDILTTEIENLRNNLDKINNEMFIISCEKLISRYEKVFDIETDISLDIQSRIDRVKAKLTTLPVFNKETIKNIFSEFEVEVTENIDDYSFTINLISEVGFKEMNYLYKDVDELKPAHLKLNYKNVSKNKGFINLNSFSIFSEIVSILPYTVENIDLKTNLTFGTGIISSEEIILKPKIIENMQLKTNVDIGFVNTSSEIINLNPKEE